MKTGKILTAPWERSVCRPFFLERSVRVRDRLGPCASPEGGPGGEFSVCRAAGVIGGPLDRTVRELFCDAWNELESCGIRGEVCSLDLMFPCDSDEEELHRIFREAVCFCKTSGMDWTFGKVGIVPGLKRPMAVALAGGCADDPSRQDAGGGAGRRAGHGYRADNGIRGFFDIVMTGWCGASGSGILAAWGKDRLMKRFPRELVERTIAFREDGAVCAAARTGAALGVPVMHPVEEGGVFRALWELAGRLDSGLSLDLRRIPVRQETIEICEYFDVNPYQLYGQGSLLMAAGASRGETLVQALKEAGIHAAVIGCTSEGADRTLQNGEELRYLEKPQQDALWRFAQETF